ncbi:hypothetical protein [Nocardia brevicatena]|uniref:hypothetical protein n=1 Tax=Nocardia brevicatena TaxID=37327 RepID=UPI0003064019|nr:hypothetical protein [Nocardia brevicatena]
MEREQHTTSTACDCGPWITVSMCGAAYARGIRGPIEQVMCLLCERMVAVVGGRIVEHSTAGPDTCVWSGLGIVDDRTPLLAGGIR